jgi:DMSO/TMAO reductase YedYZ molybdopterin-dependent catalytic subunit
VPRQLGYKSVKYITGITVTDKLEKDDGSCSWYSGI